MRTIIELDEPRLVGLDSWAQSQSISRAEAVRRAVDLLLASLQHPKGQGFGLWRQGLAHEAVMQPEQDGLAIQLALRSEWPE